MSVYFVNVRSMYLFFKCPIVCVGPILPYHKIVCRFQIEKWIKNNLKIHYWCLMHLAICLGPYPSLFKAKHMYTCDFCSIICTGFFHWYWFGMDPRLNLSCRGTQFPMYLWLPTGILVYKNGISFPLLKIKYHKSSLIFFYIQFNFE